MMIFKGLLIIISLVTFGQSQLFPQYGFAHRVNTPSNIKAVLDAGANGIEIDVCFASDSKDWYVSHNDLAWLSWLDSCACPDCDKLSVWLDTLKHYLNDNPSRSTQLAMLWIDIKTPGDDNMINLPNIVHSAELPIGIKILYGLTTLNDYSKKGFGKIQDALYNNEGVSFFGNNDAEIEAIYRLYQDKKFRRGIFDHGDSIGTNEKLLAYARGCQFMKSAANPYGFALILTWTNKLKSSIKDHTNPSDQYYTDGQIYGNALGEWSNDAEYIYLFNTIISNQDNTRLATTNDDPFNNSLDCRSRRLMELESNGSFDDIEDPQK
mmetsp:Transcript_77207/g.69140  ORF Transcript_77207/g.69140 Transcript_77207/m.69140 type:complete len:322 (+) Transcript_77207:137-1102(+)